MSISSSSASNGNPQLIEVIRGEIEAEGPITFARFMELALYEPGLGYYLTPERRPGRGGDFLTAPEASAYFGLTIARHVAECWERLERPDRFVIREYGAGVGGLAYDIIAGLTEADPDIVKTLQYRLIEPNRFRLRQALNAMREAGLGEIVTGEEVEEIEPITGVVIANEVADALPVHRLIVRDGELRECYVTLDGDRFAEVVGPLSSSVNDYPGYFQEHGIDLVEAARYDVSPAASEWISSVAQGIKRGYALIIDYGYLVTKLFRGHLLDGTVRGYFEHTVTDDPFVYIGEQDLTAHVDFTALQSAGESAGMSLAGFTTQGALLASLGLGQRLVDLQHDPEATLADYASAQAVVMRLIDPGGLGRFGVLMMAKNAPVEPPLAGFAVKPPPF